MVPVALAALLLAAPAVATAAPMAAADGRTIATTSDAPATTIGDAEQLVLDLINQRRDKKGLRPLRLDPRVAKVARARSQDQIDRKYFGHKDPSGHYVAWYLTKAGIKYSRNSEIIAWNQGSDLAAGAQQVVSAWMSDSIHRREVLSKTHNYFGAGIATNGRKVIWTVDSITGPDRTGPTARITSATWSDGAATIEWKGSDPRLVVGTAGLRDYDLAQRSAGGSWSVILGRTTTTSITTSTPSGTEFRVRARDTKGNVGAWSEIAAAG